MPNIVWGGVKIKIPVFGDFLINLLDITKLNINIVSMQIYSEKTFYLIAGPNGSGKTTIARELIGDNPKISFLNSDDIARERGITPARAGVVLLNKMQELFSARASFAFETTLSGKLHNKFIETAKMDGYKIVFLYVYLANVDQNVARVRQRVALGGHDVPEATIRRRYRKSLLNFEPVSQKSDQWELYYNGGTTCELLARGVRDRIDVIDNPLYTSFVERRAKILSEHMLELAKNGAERARILALNAGVPVISIQR